jgi:hypothetical protein
MTMDGLEILKIEHRERTAEGMDLKWALQWDQCELGEAALCYIRLARHQALRHEWNDDVPKSWPLPDDNWRPEDTPMGNIKIAAALLVMEWDRVKRVELGR